MAERTTVTTGRDRARRAGGRPLPVLAATTTVTAAVMLAAVATLLTGGGGQEPMAAQGETVASIATVAVEPTAPAPVPVGRARPTLIVGLSDPGATLPDDAGPRPPTGSATAPTTTTTAPTDPASIEAGTPSPPRPAAAGTATTPAPAQAGTAAGGSGARFVTLPPGSALPSGAECAARVRSTPENVPENTPYNQTRGHAVTGTYLSINTAIAANDYERRLDGDFVGTTDEIIQWASCKWGFDEDIVRAQVYAESTWYAGRLGDCGEQTHARTGGCASVGLIQVRSAETSGTHHPGVYPIALDSTAMNLDYALAVKRLCFEGKESWLAQTGPYGPGDEWNCLGRWFSGAFGDGGSLDYQRRVREILAERTWERL